MTDTRQQIIAQARAEFINALSHGEFTIEHKIKVDDKLLEDGKIDYTTGDEVFRIKSANLGRKVDKDSGDFCYFVKIVVE